MRNLPTNIKRNYPKKKYVPTTINNSSNAIPSLYTKGLQNIIPYINKDNRNVAAQVKTYVRVRTKDGQEMNICQTQNLLNLVDGAKGSWVVGGNTKQNKQKRRKY